MEISAAGVNNDYVMTAAQIGSLCADETDLTANLANVSALLYELLPEVSWVGFYRMTPDGTLLLGPFQGRIACTRLERGKGVCQAAAISGRPVAVEDVRSFPGHIACDSASRSEIVFPLILTDGSVWGVLDIDSASEGRFSGRDAELLEPVAAAVNAVVVRYFLKGYDEL